MTRSWVARACRVGALLGLLAWGALALGCSGPSGEEERLQATLDTLAGAVENRDASDIVANLAEDFDGPGGMNRERARAFAGVMMARYSELGVTWTLQEMDIQGDRATTRLTAMLTGKALVPGFEGRGRLMNVDLGWRMEGGEWRVVSARWTGAFEGGR